MPIQIEEKYGKLTQDDIKLILPLLPQLEEARGELQALIAKKPEKFAKKFLTTGFAWAHLYEVPFLQLLFGFLAVAGVDKDLARLAAQDEPIKALLSFVDEIQDKDWTGGSGGKFTHGDFLGYLQAIVGNLDCLVIYGTYLNDLLANAQKGDMDALFKAIRIDPSVVIAGEQGFLDEVRKAMAGKTGKQAAYLRKFRFLMQLLHEVGALGLPTKELSDLVFSVGAYDRSSSAAKNVSELILKAKAMKKSAISK
jgi:hypothetical protein